MRVALAVCVLLVGSLSPCLAAQPAQSALRIVVLQGEDAVNIIQQKTAVAPIIEVRDRNNLPVAGATVTFTVGPGATFGGGSTITVVTNAAGQAVATGLTPTAVGTVQVQAIAAFQGQTATATIAQSNVATAAQAAQGGVAAAAAGKGISGTTIALIGGGVVAGGVGIAVAAGGGPEPPPVTTTTTTSTTTTQTTTQTTTPPTTTTTTTPTTTTTSTTTTTTQRTVCTAPSLRSIGGSSAGIRVDVGAGSNFVDLDVVTNCAWTLSGLTNWIQPDPPSGNSGTTRIRLRIEPNTSTSSRTTELKFNVAGATTSFVVEQAGIAATVTYTASVGSSDTIAYNVTSECRLNVRITNISISVTITGDTVNSGQVTYSVTETLAAGTPTSCSGFAYSNAPVTVSLSSGSMSGSNLSARFGAGEYIADLRAVRQGVGNASTLDGTTTFQKDPGQSFGWSLPVRMTLQPR